MANERIFNFSAGPSMLPLSVLERAGSEITNLGGSGMSVMEMSHRSKPFIAVFEETKAKLKATLGVPDNYEILFLQGGATMQFSMIPMNFMADGIADYAVTGNFSGLAYKEAKKFGQVNLAASSEAENHTYIPAQADLNLTDSAAYFHYCANNTIFGTEWKYVPETGATPLVCDMSSNILSKPVDVSRYGLIYAGAQKNMAPAGMTVVIVHKDLLDRCDGGKLPTMLNYATMVKGDSMHNTPPCWCIYMIGLVLDWIADMGGLSGMQTFNEEKAALLYAALEGTKNFVLPAKTEARSIMNVTFRTGSEELDEVFIKEAAAQGLSTLKGHRLVGGMRASIYNAMPMEGVKKLADFIKEFDAKH